MEHARVVIGHMKGDLPECRVKYYSTSSGNLKITMSGPVKIKDTFIWQPEFCHEDLLLIYVFGFD